MSSKSIENKVHNSALYPLGEGSSKLIIYNIRLTRLSIKNGDSSLTFNAVLSALANEYSRSRYLANTVLTLDSSPLIYVLKTN
jgi:hypothetical protein